MVRYAAMAVAMRRFLIGASLGGAATLACWAGGTAWGAQPQNKGMHIAPEGLADDLTVWPNRVSYRNSDPWLVENHAWCHAQAPARA